MTVDGATTSLRLASRERPLNGPLRSCWSQANRSPSGLQRPTPPVQIATEYKMPLLHSVCFAAVSSNITSFSDCGPPVKESFFLVLTSFNIAAGIVLLFEVGLVRLTMGYECPGVAIFMAHFKCRTLCAIVRTSSPRDIARRGRRKV